MPSRPAPGGSVVPRLGLALGVSLFAGILLAGLAFPLLGTIGLVAKAGADSFEALPADLPDVVPAQRSRILAADGSVIATLYLQNRVTVPLQQVPELARKALIAIEDNRFYAHNGVDVKGTLRAALRNGTSGSVQQGGSTLTQQYVKNVLLAAAGTKAGQAAARERSLGRKLREARYALALEHRLTKDQILERYLNIAYYGNGVYGIGTAASYYFNEPVQRLTLAQGALFAGMVQNPRGYDPSPGRGAAVRAAVIARRNTVLQRMRALGFITDAQLASAETEPIRTRIRQVGNGCEAPGVRAPFFCDYIRRVLEEDTPLGNLLGGNRNQRQQRLLGGGLTIRTTLDPAVQEAAQTAVDDQVPPTDGSHVAAAADVVEPGTGAVKAMAVNRTYSDGKAAQDTKVNLALGGSSGFQGGSTFKAFVLARALQMGIPESLTLNSPQRYYSKVFTDCSSGTCLPYAPENAGDSEAGVFNMVQATAMSVNTYFVQLEERTGVEQPAAIAESMGLHQFRDGAPVAPLLRGGAFVLGSNEVSPLALTTAYATFAAHGLYCPPNPITGITDPTGQQLKLPESPCTQVLDQGVADGVTSLLRGVIDGPVPARTGRGASIGRPAAGKTGTAQSSRAAWFVGFTPQLAAGVWVGKVLPGEGLKDITINGRYYKQVYGGDIPASTWHELMLGALAGVPVQDFGNSAPAVAGTQVPVPDVTGQPFQVAEQNLMAAGFAVRQGGLVPAAPVPFGAIASTSPAAGTLVTPGSTITVFTSNGSSPPPPAPSPSPSAAAPPSQAPPSAPAPAPAPAPKRTKAPPPPPPSPPPTPTPTPSG